MYTRSSLSGVLAGGGVLFSNVWFFAPIGISLLLYEIWFRATSVREARITSLLFGTAYGAISLWWLWDALPMPGVPASIGIQAVVLGALWVLCAAVCGISFALIASPLYHIRTHRFSCVGAAALVVVAEYIRMWLFSLLALGPGSLLGAHFSQTSVGYVLSESFLLPLAALGGIWILSAIVGVSSATLALAAHSILARKSMPVFALSCVTAAALLSLYLGAQHTPALSKPLTVVVAGILHGDSRNGKEVLRAITENERTVDLVVMPEGDRFHVPDEELQTLVSGHVLILSSHHPRTERGYVSELTYQWSDTGTVGTYQKQFLMPQGEYTPYIASLLYAGISAAGGPTFENAYAPRLAPGTAFSAAVVKDTVVAGLICSDLLSPFLYPSVAQEYGVQVLVNSSNPVWFNDSELYSAKIRQIAAVHAVHARAYMLMSSIGSPAVLIAPNGSVIGESDSRGYVSRTLGY